MPRNIERDEKEAMRRKEQLMEAGFRLFSQYGIENVSLQRVADAAEVGVATLYNYYQTKVKLVIAISGKIWGDLWKEILEEKGPEIFESFTAYQYIEFYTDQIIRIYRERPEILRFSNNYKNFISREKVKGEALAEHLDVLKPAGALYHKFYEQARSDKASGPISRSSSYLQALRLRCWRWLSAMHRELCGRTITRQTTRRNWNF